jgi:hypothetical protein
MVHSVHSKGAQVINKKTTAVEFMQVFGHGSSQWTCKGLEFGAGLHKFQKSSYYTCTQVDSQLRNSGC